MELYPRRTSERKQHGQSLVVLSVLLASFMLITGLAIDLGFTYLTKAKLTKALDAACLNAARSFTPSSLELARGIARSAFAANYGSTALYTTPPVVTVDTSNPILPGGAVDTSTTLLNCSATATSKTFLARLLPTWSTVSVTASSQSKRATLIMTLVLDRSGSMSGDGGWSAATAAIPLFIGYFDNVNDYIGLVTFETYSTIDVPIGATPGNFVNAIRTALLNLHPNGATFALGGLRNAATEEGIPSVQGNVFRAIVFLTDGYANVIDDNLSCAGYSTINYGGHDSPDTTVDFFNPANGATVCSAPGNSNPGNTPTCCAATACTCTHGATLGPCTAGGTQKCFNSSSYSNQLFPFTRQWVSTDARGRTLQWATALRTQASPVTIYTIGVGNNVDTAFLQQMANDPSTGTYNPQQPPGLALQVARCPSATCSAEVLQAYQTIAANILLRLTQ